MRFASVCSGIESPSLAWHSLGWKPAWFSQYDPENNYEKNIDFASAVLKHHYPDVPNLGDMTKLHSNEVFHESQFDLLVGGTPCFVGDTLIATDKGQVNIKDVKRGDLVLTHNGRMRKVLDTGWKFSPIREIKASGHLLTETTDEHPFLSCMKDSDTSWVKAEELVVGGSYICSTYPIQEFESDMSESYLWLLGRYLADGWTRKRYGRGTPKINGIVIAVNDDKLPLVQAKIKECGLRATLTKERTCNKLTIYNIELGKLCSTFGDGALDKEVPSFIFTQTKEKAKAFLEGYISGDGCEDKGKTSISTASRKLAVSAPMLIHKVYGSSCVVSQVKVSNTKVIEGRTVNQNPWYKISFFEESERDVSFQRDTLLFKKVRENEKTDRVEVVYNIEVEEDNTYVANGIVVHNCQSFSVAGLQRGLDDPRGNLALEFVRILDTKRPTWFIWENVPGVLSSNGGRDFASILGAFSKIGYHCSYRILDARFFGVPQKRRRVFVVGHSSDWRCAAAVLFDQKSVSGDSSKSKKKRKSSPENSGGSTAFDLRGFGDYGDGSTSSTLMRRDYKGATDLVVSPKAYGYSKSHRDNGVVDVRFTEDGKANCLNTGEGCGNQSTMNIVASFDPTQITNPNNRSTVVDGKPCHSLSKNSHPPGLIHYNVVRRLTPIECERLQGFPDDFTHIPWRGRGGSPDGLRYMVIGNSMAVPVMKWIGERIATVDQLYKTNEVPREVALRLL